MCYRDNVEPLSFDGIHVACLCGDNGNGKSAIFDAMTWALWGEARSRNDDDLIHLGQSEAEVDLEFTLGGQRYRVLRKRTKRTSPSRAGQTVLEFQVADNSNFKPISGNNIMETQQKIIELLRLDYQTFVNSAFLRQGHADEFSIKRPAERKEILANILGLSLYDELEKKAKDVAGERKGKASEYESSINEINSQLANKTDYENEIGQIKLEVIQLEQQKKNEETILSSLRTQKGELDLKKEQLSGIEANLEEKRKELERWQKKHENHQLRITEYEKILAEEAAIKQGYSALMETRTLNDEFNRKLSQLLNLRERKKKLEEVIIREVQSLNVEHEKIRMIISDKESKFSRVHALEEQLIQARNDLIQTEKLEAELADKRDHARQLATSINHLESRHTQIAEQITDLNEKHNLLSQENARCPLCETELGVEGLQRIELKITSETEDKSKQQQKIDDELNKKKLEYQTLETELAHSEITVKKERYQRQSQVSIIEKELIDARQAGEELDQEKPRLEIIEQKLLTKDYAVYEQQTLSQLDKEEADLGYDAARHDQLQQRTAELQEYESRKHKLDEADSAINTERAEFAEAEKSISDITAIIGANLKKRDDISVEIKALSDIPDKLTAAETDYQALLKNERRILDTLATYEERLRHLEELGLKKQEKEEYLKKAVEEESIYRELAEAFSKKGIQAMLIRQAFPEIEMEANRLLGRMTDNRLSLTLESQRELRSRKGEPIETLDIKIGDELGTRNYEMYSGGEAFRIDLALRIAISKLLVRRAGASLPILIIDEGFGTQDSSGRERLVEAINSIQDDFEKIFVITHLEELKDSFPVLINVTKTANGSMISVS